MGEEGGMECRFELSDGEIETLLKKSMDHRPIRRTVHNDFNPDGTAGIRCKKCMWRCVVGHEGGFMNPATATGLRRLQQSPSRK